MPMKLTGNVVVCRNFRWRSVKQNQNTARKSIALCLVERCMLETCSAYARILQGAALKKRDGTLYVSHSLLKS